MKWLITVSVLVSLSPGENIRREPLTKDRVISIPVGMEAFSVVNFPEALEAIVGYGLVPSGETPSEQDGFFHFEHREESHFVVVRSLKKDARAVMTVRMAGDTYVYRLVESSDPVYSITFTNKAEPLKNEVFGRQREATTGRDVREQHYRAMINRALIHPALRDSTPAAFEGIDSVYYPAPNTKEPHPGWEAAVRSVHHFQKEDAVVIHAEVFNHHPDQQFSFLPNRLRIGVGLQSLQPVFIQGEGTVPPGESRSLTMVLQGSHGETPLDPRSEYEVRLPSAEFVPFVPKARPVSSP